MAKKSSTAGKSRSFRFNKPQTIKGPVMGRRQDDIDAIANLQRCVERLHGEVQRLTDENIALKNELIEHRTFMKKVKQWVSQLPIEARTDMPELQQ